MSNRLAWLLALACTCFLAAQLALSRGAFAQEVVAGQGLVCDTKEQIQKYAELADQPDALQVVNKDDPTACGLLQVFYIEGETVGRITNIHGKLRIVQVLVVGVLTPHGPQRVQPMLQFILMPVQDREA